MKPLLLLLLLIILPGCQIAQGFSGANVPSTPSTSNTTTYDISQTITLTNDGPEQAEKHNLWVALISDQSPYQSVLSRDIQPSNYVITADEYGNHYAEFDLKDLKPGESAHISINYKVVVYDLAYDLSECEGDLPAEFTKPELHIESNNPQIVALAQELAAPEQSVCEKARSFYDYVSSSLTYSYNGKDWGAQAALGEMGADCTEYSSLLIALSRASGIPARYVEGLLFLDDNGSVDARQEHAWVELLLPGTGWVPVDPTLGRSTLSRDLHFARYSPNHIIVTNGRSPSTLRGASYWSHLYWPGDSTTIRFEDANWTITPQEASSAH